MKVRKWRIWKWVFHDNVLCTFFVMMVMYGLSNIPINTSLIDPLSQALDDFEMSDLAFSALRGEPQGDTNIVVVNIGTLNRAGIAVILRKINACDPKVVGIDAFFRSLKDPYGDSLMAQSLKETKNLVLVSKIDRPQEDGTFDTLETSNPIFLEHATLAFANMITKEKEFRTSRQFAPQKVCKKDTLTFFAVKIAGLYDSAKAAQFLDRKNIIETINFRGNVYSGEMYNSNVSAFTALDVEDVMNDNFEPSIMKNKIVLLGYMGESLYNVKFWDEDKFYTPMNKKYAGKSFPDMFGVVVHANIISMILYGNYINVMGEDTNLWINILICFLNVVIFSFFFKKLPRWYDGFSAIVQLAEIAILFYVVVIIFDKFNLEMSVTLPILFLVLLGNFLELYYGLLKEGVLVYMAKRRLTQLKKHTLSNNEKDIPN